MINEETNITPEAENNEAQAEQTNDTVAETTEEVNVETTEEVKVETVNDATEVEASSESTPEIATTSNLDGPAVGTVLKLDTPPTPAPAPVVSAETEEQRKADESAKAEKAEARKMRQQHFEELFAKLKEFVGTDQTIEVEVKSRIRGGLRVVYEELPMFLPTSHYTLKRSPGENKMQEAVGQKFDVLIHEYQEFDEGRKAIIVSRKSLLLNKVWGEINVEDKIEGTVSSVASFGVFVEFHGVEGLIHISRLSQVHVADPNKLFKKGDKIEAVIIDIDKEKNRIALSRKELEESPWKGAEQEFAVGSHQKGIVRRLTDFGAYIELKPGVDGLLRSAELSWTKRVKKPSDVLQTNSEITVEILSVSDEKRTAALSLKRTTENPWPGLAEKYPLGAEFNATILQVIPQGAILSLNEEIDGFMPRSKMRPVLDDNKIPYQTGDKVDILIADINPEEESLILAPKLTEEQMAKAAATRPPRREGGKGGGRREGGRGRGGKEDRSAKIDPKNAATGNSSFSIGDLLNDSALNKLKDIDE
ncbi:MAG: S1 RNA-binding domain-containing protein [Candidatus Kapabacteria bacterium]|jgi:ribosomal protein S1|nr:S1 RNA-binding domain-containing protein [Candidatus Kapabacteria bacterium]